MMRVLTKPRNVLLATVEAWLVFNSEEGDVEHFFDDPDADATTQEIEASAARHRSMKNIKSRFCELREYHSEIVALDKRCADYKKAVSRHCRWGGEGSEDILLTTGMKLELSLALGQKEGASKNELTSVFTVKVCISKSR
jgi:hypothetical protein